MRLRNILIGAGVLAALLGGLWLLLQQIPVTADAVQQKCVKDHRTVLTFAYIRLPEGVTWEEFEAGMLAYCECFAREASRQLTQEELVAIVQKERTPAIDVKLAKVYQQCRPKNP